METINYTEARQRLKSAMEKVVESHAPIIITRQDADSVVMMSLADYNALEETAYLLRSPKNATRLLESVKQAKAKKHRRRKLIEN